MRALAEGVQTAGTVEAAAARQVPERAPAAGAASCPECDAAFVGDYCHRCGEKRPEAYDLSVRHFAKDAAQELTSLDSKLLRTLLTLLFRPGMLTVEWLRGRRGRYLKPLNLCLGIFAVNLFAFTASKQVTMFDVGIIIRQEKQMLEQWHLKGRGVYERLFADAAARKHVTPESLEDAVNDKWQRNVSLSQSAQIILLALLLQVVYLFSRRYFVEHLVFSMHFLSFTALTVTMMWPIYYFIGINPTPLNMLVACSKFALDIFYLFVALRAVYSGSSALAMLRALIVFAGYFAIYIGSYVAALAAALFAVLR